MFFTRISSRKAWALVCLAGSVLTAAAQTVPPADKSLCSRTAQMRVFSSAFFSKESGDVVGYNFAVSSSETSSDALLFVYEGAPNNDGIPLRSQQSGDKLSVSGTWVERQIEYPSKKEIVVTHPVMIEGLLRQNSLEGHITIGGLQTLETLRMKRVKHLWLCK
jgi:hypothetical protein